MKMSLAHQIFNMIPGTWRLYRNIPGTGYLNGYALFEVNPNNSNEIFYSETGIFYFNNGKSLEASKKYVYCLQEDNNDIYVYDCNYVLFHKFGLNKLEESEPDDTPKKCVSFSSFYICKEDKFNISYDFNLDNNVEFSIIHDVKSPRNDYVSKSRFKRIKEVF